MKTRWLISTVFGVSFVQRLHDIYHTFLDCIEIESTTDTQKCLNVQSDSHRRRRNGLQNSLNYAYKDDAHFDIFIKYNNQPKFISTLPNGDKFCLENGDLDLMHDEIQIIPQNDSQEISENF